MSDNTQKPKRGRPTKEVLTVAPNVSDASLELLHTYGVQIADLMRRTPATKSWIAQAEQAEREALLHALALEVTFYPAMAGLVEAIPQKRTGPKPKTAQSLFMTQVRKELASVGVELPQWKNGRGQRTDLTDFCAGLIGMSGQRVGAITSRTVNNAPEYGWGLLP